MSLAGRLAARARRAWLQRLPPEALQRELAGRRGALFLCYHSLSPELDDYPYRTAVAAFDRHLEMLAEGFDILPAAAVVAELRAGTASGRARPLAAICFDDGYRDNWHLATPVLERYGVPATLFAARDLLRQGGASFMTEAELCALAAHPLWQVGAHGISHSVLNALHPDDRRREMAGCRDWLADLLGAPPAGFAYPLGQTSPSIVATARDLYDHAFSTDRRIGPGFDAWQILRYCPTAIQDDPNELARELLLAPFEDGRQ